MTYFDASKSVMDEKERYAQHMLNQKNQMIQNLQDELVYIKSVLDAKEQGIYNKKPPTLKRKLQSEQ